MAKRSGFSRSYLGNVETGVREVTPGVIRAYQRVLGEDVDRRSLLIGAAASFAAGAVPAPDVAVDIARDVAKERSKLLSTVQTSHEVDRVIARLIARDAPSVASLAKWTRGGPPVLRVNAAGILAKLGSPALDNDVVSHLRVDRDAAVDAGIQPGPDTPP
jgi:transcriptional regulator with XRE-family HTH domain